MLAPPCPCRNGTRDCQVGALCFTVLVRQVAGQAGLSLWCSPPHSVASIRSSPTRSAVRSCGAAGGAIDACQVVGTCALGCMTSRGDRSFSADRRGLAALGAHGVRHCPLHPPTCPPDSAMLTQVMEVTRDRSSSIYQPRARTAAGPAFNSIYFSLGYRYSPRVPVLRTVFSELRLAHLLRKLDAACANTRGALVLVSTHAKLHELLVPAASPEAGPASTPLALALGSRLSEPRSPQRLRQASRDPLADFPSTGSLR